MSGTASSAAGGLHQQIITHGTNLIDQILSQAKGSAKKVLVLQDRVIQPLSSFIQASQLKARGFEKWYRLSNEQDVDIEDGGVLIVFLASVEDLLIKMLLRMVQNSKEELRVFPCFVPRRRCGQVSQLLLSVRHGLNSLWQEQTDGGLSIAGKLWLSVHDVPIYLYLVDPSTMTLSCSRSYQQVHLDGDVTPLNNVFDGVRQLLSYTSLASVVSVVGVGPDAQPLAKKLVNYLAPLVDPSANNAGSLTPTPLSDKSGPNSLVTQLHDYATNLIQTHSSKGKPMSPTTAVNATSIPGQLMPDTILNRCIVQLSPGNLQEDVDFVYDEIGESGLTKRAQQPSFTIRLPSPVDWPPPATTEPRSPSDIVVKSIIVMDRAVDWISPLLTPFTYEAMLDLEWGIQGVNNLNVPADGGVGPAESVKLLDSLFFKIRDMLLTDIGPVLHNEALRIQSQQPPAPAGDAPTSVDEMHSALLKIKEHERVQRELSTHVGLVSRLVRDLWKNPAFFTILKIEDDILNNQATPLEVYGEILSQLAWRNGPVVDVLRLTMLVILLRGQNSRVSEARTVVSFVQTVLNALVGVHGLMVYQQWHELESMVFGSGCCMTYKSSASSSSPLSYVHSGFAPLSVEILESLVKQEQHPACQASQVYRRKLKVSEGGRKEGDIVLVFPHHITYSELAALRTLAHTIGRHFIVVANAIDGYNTFIGTDRRRTATPYTEELKSTVL